MAKESLSPRQSWGLPITIVALGAVAAGAWSLLDPSPNVPPLLPSPTPTLIAAVPVTPGAVMVGEADPVIGADDAPQTIFLFTQWHCAFCRHFFEATFPQLKEHFIDTGQVRLVFKLFPIGDQLPDTEQTQRVAQAAYCADEQQAFWEYAHHLFAPGAGYAVEDLIGYARAEELAEGEFVACLAGEEYAEVMATTIRSAVATGVTATPAFVIDDQLYEGALSYAELERILR